MAADTPIPTPEQPATLGTSPEVGDSYDEDTGDFLGTLDLPDGLPAQIAIFKDNYWYIFKPSGRYKEDLIVPASIAGLSKEVRDLAAELDKEGKDLSAP